MREKRQGMVTADDIEEYVSSDCPFFQIEDLPSDAKLEAIFVIHVDDILHGARPTFYADGGLFDQFCKRFEIGGQDDSSKEAFKHCGKNVTLHEHDAGRTSIVVDMEHYVAAFEDRYFDLDDRTNRERVLTSDEQ